METQGKGRKPDYIAKVVAGEKDNERWTSIGVAFSHDDSIHVLSDVLPQGKVILFKYVERTEEEKQRRFK